MALRELLTEKSDRVVGEWRESILQDYSEEGARLYGTELDPFANPVGNHLRSGTREALTELLAGRDPAAIAGCLTEIVKIRSVQQFPASEGLAFVFRLKGAARAALGEAAADPDLRREWEEFDRTVDAVGLACFDLYSEHREKVYELRMNETKRRVSWVIDKLNQRDGGPGVNDTDPIENTSER